MDLDKLKKLIRLANNNPSEHEANSAARRVCKMLDEYEFPTTWNDVKRSTEPAFKSTWKQPAPTKDPMEDIFERIFKERMYNNPYTDPFRRSWTDPFKPGSWDKDNPFVDPPKARQEPKLRKCVKCGKEERTRRITNIFTCNKCEWTEFERNNSVNVNEE
jgi:hypothetical protein